MNDEYKLQVFISYAEKGRNISDPLVQAIKKIYPCEIVWGRDEVTEYQDQGPENMMEAMAKRGDVAIFLLTHDSEGVYQEMRLWYKCHGNQFVNALLLKDHSISPDRITTKAGFEVIYVPLSSSDPWPDIEDVLPAINKLIMRGLSSANIPPSLRKYYQILHRYSWKISPDSLDGVKKLFIYISERPKYRDAELWSFRVNWDEGLPDMDSYSDPINCLHLLDALLQTEATRQEYEFIFGAIDRVVRTNSEPPRKLSGNIIFAGCSISTLRSLQASLGNYEYEKNYGFRIDRAHYAERVPDQPTSLLLPKSILGQGDNYERFLGSQRLILSAVSKVCKYVVCSTVEISASHSFLLSTKENHDVPDGVLAMSCTATRTNKDSLSAISEVPVVMEENQKINWYGQPYKKPTSEYRPHWIYHSRNNGARVAKNLLIHFHPIDLVDSYRKVRESKGFLIGEAEFIKEITWFFRGRVAEFHVFEEYQKYSSRDPKFGEFMRDTIKDDPGQYSVIWKPNHGLWVFLNEEQCSDGDSDEELVKLFLELDKISRQAAKSIDNTRVV